MIASLILALIVVIGDAKYSSAHIIGNFAVSKVDKYTVSFTPVPTVPIPNQVSGLRFGMQDEAGAEVFGIFASVKVESLTNNAIQPFSFPETFYEFGDITMAYTFPQDGLYKVTLEARINTDSGVPDNVATSFEVPVGNYQRPFQLLQGMDFQAILSYAAIAGGAGILAMLYLRSRSEKRAKAKS